MYDVRDLQPAVEAHLDLPRSDHRSLGEQDAPECPLLVGQAVAGPHPEDILQVWVVSKQELGHHNRSHDQRKAGFGHVVMYILMATF